jgi:hypothetical protein
VQLQFDAGKLQSWELVRDDTGTAQSPAG